MRSLLILFIINLMSLSPIKTAYAEFQIPTKWSADLVPLSINKIEGLKLNSTEFPVKVYQNSGSAVIEVTIRGQYLKKDWALVFDEKPVTIEVDQSFEIVYSLKGPTANLDFLAIGPLGELKKETFGLNFKQYLSALSTLPKSQKSWNASLGFGLTSSQYQEKSSIPPPINIDSQQMGLTLKASFLYQIFAPNIDLGLSSYFTALTLSTTDVPIKYFGFNVRTGYSFSLIDPSWRFGLMAGYYLMSTFVPGNTFGYQNVGGPQVFPTFRKTFSPGHSLSTYFKFSPILQNSGLMALSNREIAVGLGYTHPLFGYPISFSLDWSQLKLTFQDAALSGNTLTWGLGLGF